MAFLFDDLLRDVFTVKQQDLTLNATTQQYTDIYAPQTTYTPTYTLPQYAINPATQYNPQFIIGSAGASATGGIIAPSVTQSQVVTPTITPTSTITPTQTSTTDQTADQGMGLGGGIDWTTIAIVGAIGIVAYLVLTSPSGKKRVKRGYRKAKKTGKKTGKYAAKAAKYAVMLA